MSSENQSLTEVAIGAAEVLADLSRKHPAIYLPNGPDREPILYREEGAGQLKPDFTRLRQSGVASILVRGEDLTRCEEILENHLARVLKDPGVSNQQKAACVQQVGTSVVRDLLEREAAPETVDRASGMLDLVIENVLAQPGVASTLLRMSAHHQSTASHMFAVSTLAVLLGTEVLGADEQSLKELGLAGILHDVGKLHVGANILNKPTPLSADEIRMIQHHPIESVRLLADSAAATSRVREMILQHHERYDGQGYPLGLKGDEILIGSRILSIVDSFHAMIGRRVYKRAITPAEAVCLMKYQQGRQFDPRLYTAWVGLFSRCWQNQPDLQVPAAEATPAQESFHRDHKLERAESVSRRQPRRPCMGKLRVACYCVGRLSGLPHGPMLQSLALHDLSRSGLCLNSDHAMYRGEVLHLVLETGAAKMCVRGVVAWCRRESVDNGFKIGVRLTERISSGELSRIVPVRAMNDPLLFSQCAP